MSPLSSPEKATQGRREKKKRRPLRLAPWRWRDYLRSSFLSYWLS